MEVKKFEDTLFGLQEQEVSGLKIKLSRTIPQMEIQYSGFIVERHLQEGFTRFHKMRKTFISVAGRKALTGSKTEQIISGFSSNCSQSTFEETNLNYAIWINPSNFWKNCQIRMSLFSILLRCGSLYNPEEDNYEEALFSQDYSKRTKPAVMRFLFGFTNFNGEQQNQGWVRTFENKKILELRNSLISDKKEFLFLGKNSLWT